MSKLAKCRMLNSYFPAAPRAVRNEAKSRVSYRFDATRPLVTKVHKVARQPSRVRIYSHRPRRAPGKREAHHASTAKPKWGCVPGLSRARGRPDAECQK
ncbi:hypothetical protein KCP69_25030 [Salmonella enterica subsp. enterica]|nr:hypothetical protein KCP69_25030 [Salmonella enterica subsp. enterica]